MSGMEPVESNARDSAQSIRANFAFIDADGSHSLSRDELRTFIADTHRSETLRGAAADILNHFDIVAGMGTQTPPKEMTSFGASINYGREFSDQSAQDVISTKDLELLQRDYTDANLQTLTRDARELNVKAGAFMIGMGACVTVLGANLTVAAIAAAPLGWAAVPVTGTIAWGGLALAGVGVNELVADESTELASAWQQRRGAVQLVIHNTRHPMD